MRRRLYLREDRLEALREEIRETFARVVREEGCLQLLARHAAAMEGWSCSPRAAEARISKWCRPDGVDQIPAEVLLLLIALTGRRADFAGLFLEALDLHERVVVPELEDAGSRRRRPRRRASR